MKLSAIATAIGVSLSSSAVAQDCYQSSEFVQLMDMKGGELRAIGDNAAGQIQIWTTRDDKFIIVISPTEGVTCLLVGGENMTFHPAKPNI